MKPTAQQKAWELLEATIIHEGVVAGSLKRVVRRPVCVKWKCEKVELHWLKKGLSLQTENGHFTAGGDGWICPKCGGGYGSTPSPND